MRKHVIIPEVFTIIELYNDEVIYEVEKNEFFPNSIGNTTRFNKKQLNIRDICQRLIPEMDWRSNNITPKLEKSEKQHSMLIEIFDLKIYFYDESEYMLFRMTS